ncbi:MAG: hydrogenase formation protein HypD [Chloroflexota bacterium]
MQYVDEFRDESATKNIIRQIHDTITQSWTIMEICGGQTHSIVRHGIDQLLPEQIELVHGPGCPVCVTPLEIVDQAILIASREDVIFCSFGDMLRVPGSAKDLFQVRAEGGDVRVLYSPLDAINVATANPEKQVVFFGIGFETTAPANAGAILQAHAMGIENFSILVSHVRVPPAIHALLSSPESRIQGFLAAGHVCTVMGYHEYHSLADKFEVPIVVTGFEPVDITLGILAVVNQLENGQSIVANAYPRAVTEDGNQGAQAIISKVFESTDRKWRGIGTIADSGWSIRDTYAQYDAALRFDTGALQVQESDMCLAGQVLQGLLNPEDCPAFGSECTPRNPLGAPMVSAEGACAAYFTYRRASIDEQ